MGYYEDVYLKRLNRYGVDFQSRMQGQREENFRRQLMRSVYYVNFDYDGNEIRYISKIDSYITSSLLEKKKTNIEREIINITLDEEKVIIETVEGLVKDNYIYNILTDEKYEESELLTLKDKLTHVTYTFKNDNLIDLNNPNLELKD